MNYAEMNQYLSPEDAAKLAGIEDPELRMGTLIPMVSTAKNLQGIRPMERSNGRVVGATSALEAIGAAGANMAGAYMNKNMMDRYGAIMDENNKSRIEAAMIMARANALRKAKPGMPETPTTGDPYSASSFPVEPYSPARYTELDPI